MNPRVASRFRSGMKWIAVAACGGLLSLAIADLYQRVVHGPARPELVLTENWEVFGRLYLIDPPSSSTPNAKGERFLQPLGGEPYYRHTVVIRNNGAEAATTVKVRIVGLRDSHQLSVEPALIAHEITALQRDPWNHGPAGAETRAGDAFREVHFPILPPYSSVQIQTVAKLGEPVVPFSRTEVVTADNASGPRPVQAAESTVRIAELNSDLAKIYAAFPTPDIPKWNSSNIQASVEFHPN